MSFILSRCFYCFSNEDSEFSSTGNNVEKVSSSLCEDDNSELEGGLQIFRTERKTVRYKPY